MGLCLFPWFPVGTSAKLTLKKSPSEDKTFLIPINIKDNAGMGITQKFEGEWLQPAVCDSTHHTQDHVAVSGCLMCVFSLQCECVTAQSWDTVSPSRAFMQGC